MDYKMSPTTLRELGNSRLNSPVMLLLLLNKIANWQLDQSNAALFHHREAFQEHLHAHLQKYLDLSH